MSVRWLVRWRSMRIGFAKAEASGNDFIIVDNRGNTLGDNTRESAPGGKALDFGAFARFACRRRYSVGADGLLVLEDSEKADFRMRIFNPDSSEVTMCGNGIRCSALYAHAKGWCASRVKIETDAGILEVKIEGESVMVKMTPPKDIKLNQNIGVGKTILNIHTVNTGVPHAVHFVESIKDYPVKEVGRKVRYHKHFEPEGTNADFVEELDNSTILVRTYERGVEDETMACGTGVVASAIISHLVNGARNPVNAITKGGGEALKIHFKKERKEFGDVYLEGSAKITFEGGIDYV